jgi:hypothetical protein
MSVLFLSQAIEDAQYGVRSILNNIPLLIMSLGGGPGLAGVVSLAAVAFNALNEHMDLFGILTGKNADATAKLAEALGKTREEVEKLAESEKQRQEQRKQLGEVPGAQAKSQAQLVAEAIQAVGGEMAIANLTKAIEEQMKKRGPVFGQVSRDAVEKILSAAQGKEGLQAQEQAQMQLMELLSGTRAFGRTELGGRLAQAGAAAAQQRMMGAVGRDFATQMAIGAMMAGPMGPGGAMTPEQATKDLRTAERQKEEAEREAEQERRKAEAESRKGAQDFLQNNPGIMEILKGNLAMRGADQHAVYAVNAMLRSQTGLPNEVSYAVVNQALLELMRELTMRQNRIDAQFNSAAQYMRMLRESLEGPAAMQNNGRF